MKKKERIVKAKEYLKCEFSEEERREMSMDLARNIGELKEKEAGKKEVVKSLDAELAKLEATIGSLATKVKDGYEYRNVDCDIIFNYDTKKKSFKRLDTGDVFKEQELRGDDLQVPLMDEEAA